MKKAVLFFLIALTGLSSSWPEQVPGAKRAIVVIDPGNKQNIRGYVHLAIIFGEMLKPPAMYPRYLINLKEAFTRWTKINVLLDSPCRVDSPRFLEMPVIYLTTYEIFDLTPFERDNIRQFFDNGGFMVLDNARPTLGLSDQEASLKRLLFDALGEDIRLGPIPLSHPIFHVFFDLIEGAPPGVGRGTPLFEQFYLSGIWVNDRLVAVLSNRGYTIFMNDPIDNEPQLRFGVNMVLYGLMYGGKQTNSDQK